MTRPFTERGVSEPLPLSSEEIGELERLLEKATFDEGGAPWACEPIKGESVGPMWVHAGRQHVAENVGIHRAALIVAMRNALPRLLLSLKQERGGKAEALEEAAKVAEGIYGEDATWLDQEIGADIAKRIRSLKEKPMAEMNECLSGRVPTSDEQ